MIMLGQAVNKGEKERQRRYRETTGKEEEKMEETKMDGEITLSDETFTSASRLLVARLALAIITCERIFLYAVYG